MWSVTQDSHIIKATDQWSGILKIISFLFPAEKTWVLVFMWTPRWHWCPQQDDMSGHSTKRGALLQWGGVIVVQLYSGGMCVCTCHCFSLSLRFLSLSALSSHLPFLFCSSSSLILWNRSICRLLSSCLLLSLSLCACSRLARSCSSSSRFLLSSSSASLFSLQMETGC